MGWALWITGLPGSGKSVLARAAADALRSRGEPVQVLELDEIRTVLTPAPTYTAEERELVYRALVHLARLLTEAGVPVIVDATAHRRAWRDLARRAIPRFAEVQLQCPLAVCRERERRRTTGHAPRGIYARAGEPGATVPGVDVPYEFAVAPELSIDTAAEEVGAAVARIVALARRLAPGDVRRGDGAPGWVIWITGLPGSGKSTLAREGAEALRARGIHVRVLDLPGTRSALLPPGAASKAAIDIVHRTLACAAQRLSDAGLPVIVEATAPRRAWRELARSLIPHFAEVELLCPSELCWSREQAVRWRLAGATGGGAEGVAPGQEMVLDYEPSLRPDLAIRTDIHDVWASAGEVVALALRLHGRAAARTFAPERRGP